MEQYRDLFGNLVSVTTRGRGRPAFVWTEEKSNKIKLGLALGWSVERLANGLACSTATLRRYFRSELAERDAARDQLDLERAALAMAQAKTGNVGAMRQLDRLIEANDRMLAHRGITAPSARPEPVERLGKKAAAAKAAETAGEGSAWGALLIPGLGTERVN